MDSKGGKSFTSENWQDNKVAWVSYFYILLTVRI